MSKSFISGCFLLEDYFYNSNKYSSTALVNSLTNKPPKGWKTVHYIYCSDGCYRGLETWWGAVFPVYHVVFLYLKPPYNMLPGGKTQMASIVSSLSIIPIILAFGPCFEELPQVSLL